MLYYETMTGSGWTMDIVEEEILIKLVILVSEIKAIYSPPPKCSVQPILRVIILPDRVQLALSLKHALVCSGLVGSGQ